MSEFKTPLEVRMLPETDNQSWMLLSPLVYESAAYGGQITVPEGFITDFVSFAPLKNIGQRPAVVHDFLTSFSDVTNVEAANIFKEALAVVGIEKILADAMFNAVICFGSSHHTNDFKLSDHSQQRCIVNKK